MKPIVFIPEKIAACGLALLRASCDLVMPWESNRAATADELRASLRTADAVIVRLFKVTADDIAGSRLKVIAKHGVGVDNIDVAAATAKKIPVVFTPAANANGVAEHTMALMLGLCRHIAPAAVATQQGRFSERTKLEGVELAGKTLGVVGLGRIGSRVAEMARDGFAMRVLGFDPFLKRDAYKGAATLVESLQDLLPACDFISFHVPLSGETKHLISETSLRTLKPSCRIINTSRGAVIDELALASALEKRTIAGAALDVFEAEPLPADDPLCRAPNILLTPHISSSTTESLERMATDSAQGVLDVLEGRRPKYPANPGGAIVTKWIDVTRPLDARVVCWPSRTPPTVTWEKRVDRGHHCNVSSWQISAHAGTHIDAPLHFVDGAKSIDQVSPDVLIGACVVADLRRFATPTLDLMDAEKFYGVDRLLLASGYPGGDGLFVDHGSLLTTAAAKRLLAGGLVMIGTDRLSVDASRNSAFEIHHELLGAGCAIIEGLELSGVPDGDYKMCALPLRMAGAEASPARVFLQPVWSDTTNRR